MSVWLVALSVAITALSLPGTWIQVLHVFRTRSAHGLSLATQLLWIWSSFIWAAYGLLEGNTILFVTNVSSAVGGTLIVAGAARFGGAPVLAYLLSTLVFAMASVAAYATWGLAPIMVVLVVASRTPQTIRTWRTPGGSGVSLVNFGLGGSCCALWLVLALAIGDFFLAATSAYGAVFGAFVVLRERQGRTALLDRRLAVELEAAIVYERHQMAERRLERPIDVVEVPAAV